jgi:hypothetical protein
MGPFEAEIDGLLKRGYEGSPQVLEAALEGRDSYSHDETIRFTLRLLGVHAEGLRRVARQIDLLAARE